MGPDLDRERRRIGGALSTLARELLVLGNSNAVTQVEIDDCALDLRLSVAISELVEDYARTKIAKKSSACANGHTAECQRHNFEKHPTTIWCQSERPCKDLNHKIDLVSL